MTVFLALGGLGIILLAVFIFVDDHLGGVFDALGGGDWFTGASLAGFLGALGFGGAIVYNVTDSLELAILVGVLLGLFLGAVTTWLMVKMRSTQEGGAPTSADLVGLQGTVVSAVPVDGYGEIKVTQAGQIVKLNARSAIPLPIGVPVEITEVLTATAVRIVPLYR
jgi:membrane protein implicated in regulation of membrane protease activity